MSTTDATTAPAAAAAKEPPEPPSVTVSVHMLLGDGQMPEVRIRKRLEAGTIFVDLVADVPGRYVDVCISASREAPLRELLRLIADGLDQLPPDDVDEGGR